MKNEYHAQAEKFMKDHNVKMQILFTGVRKHFDDDKEPRNCYQVTISRSFDTTTDSRKNAVSFSFPFGDSIRNTQDNTINADGFPIPTKKPHAYDILACLTSYDPDTFENFCSSFGYDEDSRKAEKVYQSVVAEYNNVANMFNEQEREQLVNIQ